jgi:hypothetical protein
MATIQDADESVRQLALLIPAFTLDELTPVELDVRLRYVLGLRARAEAQPDKAGSLRKRADKALKSMSPAAYAAALGRLDDALANAHLRGATREAMAILEEITWLKRTHPQPDPQLYIDAGMVAVTREVERRVTIPSHVNSRLFSRRSVRKGHR